MVLKHVAGLPLFNFVILLTLLLLTQGVKGNLFTNVKDILSLYQGEPCPVDYCQHEQSCPIPALLLTPLLEDEIFLIKRSLKKALKELKAKSLVVGVVQNGRSIFNSFHGFETSKVTSAKVSGNSRYRIASISKLFTSIFLFQLRDQGLVSLDTPVKAIYPNYRDPKGVTITLRALAMHTSGLPRDLDCGADCSEEDILKEIADARLLFPQYSATAYSNLGIALLGRALEHVANTKWEDWIAERILAPLKMKNSGAVSSENASIVEGVDPVSGIVESPNQEVGWTSPAGSMYSSTKDMEKFMSFLLGSLKVPKVLSVETLREMRNTGFVQPDGTSISSGTFETVRIAGVVANSKAGCLPGYRSDVVIVPSLSLGIFAAASSTCDVLGDGDYITFPIATRLIKRLSLLFKTAKRSGAPLLPMGTKGNYCNANHATVVKNHFSLSGQSLVMVNGPNGDPRLGLGLSYTLVHVKGDLFQMKMGLPGQEFLPKSWPKCSRRGLLTSKNECPLSCMRRMSRGDSAFLEFKRDKWRRVVGFQVLGGKFSCTKTSLFESVSEENSEFYLDPMTVV